MPPRKEDTNVSTVSRRNFLELGSIASAALTWLRPGQAQGATAAAPRDPRSRITTPNGSTLPLTLRDGVYVGHLVAEAVQHEFAPGLAAECWGFNGGTPGPTIEAVAGDRLRLYVTNRLSEPTSVHWHGLIIPNGMDGVSGLNQAPIEPGETWVYEFQVNTPGTYMYHPHYDEMTQMALGMHGIFVVHPKAPDEPITRDYAMMVHEWRIEPGAKRPDPNAMADFNVLTFNSKVFPGTEPLLAYRGERIRIRFGNLSPMDHHPIHIHGLNFRVTATDGGPVPRSAQRPETTVLVPVGSTRVIEFEPPESGDWAMHCHMTHHVMTQMGHGMPPSIGADTKQLDRRMRNLVPGYMTMGTTGMGGMGEMGMPVPTNSLPMRGAAGPHSYIDMGGMFTVLKVREPGTTLDPKSWYEAPPATRARRATSEELQLDSILPRSAKKAP